MNEYLLLLIAEIPALVLLYQKVARLVRPNRSH